MTEKASLDPRLRKIDEARNYLLEEVRDNDLISGKYKKTCKYLNYVDYLLILVAAFNECVSVFAFASLVCTNVDLISPAVGLKFCAITAGIKTHKSV